MPLHSAPTRDHGGQEEISDNLAFDKAMLDALPPPSAIGELSLGAVIGGRRGERLSPIQVAIVDVEWTILAANSVWLNRVRRDPFYSVLGIGANFRAFCDDGAAQGFPGAAGALEGMNRVERGEIRQMRQECVARGSGEDFELTITRIDSVTGCFGVISCANISELHILRDRQRHLAISLMHAQEDERRRVARDLHDTSAQHLVGMSLGLARLRNLDVPPLVATAIADLSGMLDNFYRDLRGVAFLMHPPELQPGKLVEAVEVLSSGFATRSETEVNLRVYQRTPVELSPEVEAGLYRLLQEALGNVQKHAQASRVNVRLDIRPETVLIAISDNGIGIEAAMAASGARTSGLGVGIAGMIARISDLGGRLSVHSAPNRRGTLVAAGIPNDHAA